MKIVADDKIPFLAGVLEPYAEVIYKPGKLIDNHDVIDADALIVRTRTKCNAALLEGSSVRFIGTATIGFDHIDVDYCASKGITWTNAPGCNSSSVKQYVASALLNLACMKGFELKGKTIGIVGVGNVGSKVESLAKALGMNVLLNDPPRARREGREGFVDLEYLLDNSDIVTVHVPLDRESEDATFHLFNDFTMAQMKHKAYFINASRGEIADTEAIKKALDSKKISGAILDVWEKEPVIDRHLMRNTIFSTPHIAGYSTDGKANGTAQTVNALSEFFGLPIKNWYPQHVPAPENPDIHIYCSDKTEQEILQFAVNRTYNINHDSDNLRNMPDDFEKLRGNYRLRREFQAYKVSLSGNSGNAADVLTNMGFVID